MRIFFLLAMTALGGTAHIALRMAAGLVARGHKVRMFLPQNGGDLAARARDYDIDVDMQMVMTTKLRRPVQWVKDMQHLRAAMLEFQPDIVQTFRPADLYLAVGARALVSHPPALLSARTIVNPVIPHPFNVALQSRVVNQVLCTGEVIFQRYVDPVNEPCPDETGVYYRKAPQRWMRWWNSRRFNLANVAYLRDGIDPARTQPSWANAAALTARVKMRQALGFDENTVVVGMLARMAAVKGHKTLAQALQRLQPSLPGQSGAVNASIGVLLVGPTNTNIQHMLEGMLQEYQRAGRLKITGFRQDPIDCLHAMDVFVHPSLGSEGNARALLEAMVCGLCPVVSTAGVLPEYVRHENNGLVFPVGDWQMLADHLKRVIADPAQRRQFARNSRLLAETDYSHEVFLDRLSWLYRRLVRRQPVSGSVAVHADQAPVSLDYE